LNAGIEATCALAAVAMLAPSVRIEDGDDPPRVVTASKGVETTYVTRTIEGFTVHVDSALLAETVDDDAARAARATGERALAVLSSHLFQIARSVRAESLAKLRSIPIFLSHADPVAKCACYHPSPEWLRQNGFDPRKAKSVEIAQAGAFIDWTHEQPWMVLHELAHGYDDLHLDPATDLGRELESLFEQAKQSGTYDEVLHWPGDRQRHYALNTSEEYFAESVEAWFGANDFFPFVRAELLHHDPALADFLRRVLGEPITSRTP
jgi:hypothetical protein